MILPATRSKKVEIKIKHFFPQNPDLAGLMMDTKNFQFWPFWPKLLRFKVAFKFGTPAEIWVKCEPVGRFFWHSSLLVPARDKRGRENMTKIDHFTFSVWAISKKETSLKIIFLSRTGSYMPFWAISIWKKYTHVSDSLWHSICPFARISYLYWNESHPKL